ncbi:MAG: response regulator transcription factor [Opitutae bacterium]|nr:response regulator transcription factor [Opitutae bacterium]
MTAAAAATISILIVDDSPLVRHGIRAAIESEPTSEHLQIVGEADTAFSAVAEAQRLRPDVVLLDLRLPDDSGLNTCRKLRELLPATCVIVLTSSTDDRSIYDSVIAGAQGYLLKEIHPATLIQAIEDGFAGRPVFTGDIAMRVLDIIRQNQTRSDTPSALASLSPQERRVLAAMAEGHTNKEIADLLGLSTNTVKNYIANMFQKLGIERRSQATALYLNNRPTRPE